MPYKDPERAKAYWRRRNAEPARSKASSERGHKWTKDRPDVMPFVAIDSEGFSYGAPIEKDGKRYKPHRTFLWGASDQDGDATWLQNGGAIGSTQILDWLLDLPGKYSKSIFVSFSFSYDAAQIFADLPYEKLWELQRGAPWSDQSKRKNSKRLVLWGDYGFSYLKGKKLQLYRFPKGNNSPYVLKNGKRKLNASSKILIYDVFGYFQSSFLKACKSMPGAVTSAEYDLLFSGKGNRANFQPSDIEAVKLYTKAELVVLARMMTKMREAMIGENIHVRNWFGAGTIAQALLKRECVSDHYGVEIKTRQISEPQRWAHHAYFGGRIELLAQGVSRRELHGYDIASAYPFIATLLPSMRGGSFRFVANPDRHTIERTSLLSIVHIRTHNLPRDAPFFPLPYRTPKGAILFPREVNGYYMAAEARAAFEYCDRLGGQIEVVACYEFVEGDAARPFAFLQTLFDYRASLLRENINQIVIKLGINSCYGKTAQAVAGSDAKPPKFANPWYAAAITGGTRAAILRAALHAPSDIVMLATDGIISKSRLPLVIPEKKTLGSWEYGKLSDGGIFVQSGVYALSDADGNFSAKSRGFRPVNMGEATGGALGVMRNVIPGLWAQDRAALEFKYQSYMTLGASVASRDNAAFIGYWLDGVRQLDLRGSGLKRNVAESKTLRKARAKKLIASRPNCANSMLLDRNGEMLLSTMFTPEWIDPELGELAAINSEVEDMLLGRYGDG